MFHADITKAVQHKKAKGNSRASISLVTPPLPTSLRRLAGSQTLEGDADTRRVNAELLISNSRDRRAACRVIRECERHLHKDTFALEPVLAQQIEANLPKIKAVNFSVRV